MDVWELVQRGIVAPESIASSAGHYIDFSDLTVDDLDEQTKRELLLDPNFRQFTGAVGPDPKCRWCKGTGRLKMLTTETDCDCVRSA